MKETFNTIPFFRFFLPFVSGILVNVGFELNQENSWLLIGIYALILLAYFVIRLRSAPFKKLLFGVLVNF
ncbi:MAG: hypothetical protein ACJ76F_05650, partial [Bacteroidia bacterium]